MDELSNVLHNSSLDKIGGEGTTSTLAGIVEAVAVASILFEIIKRVEKLSESVEDLGKRARFKPRSTTKVAPPPVPADSEKEKEKKKNQNEHQNEKSSHLLHRGTVKPINDGDHVIIPVCPTVTCQQESAPEIDETSPNKPVLSVAVN